MLRAVRKAAALKIVVYEGTYGGTYGGTNEYEGVLINKLPSYIRRYEGTKVPSYYLCLDCDPSNPANKREEHQTTVQPITRLHERNLGS
mgnify:CR=1 FL=1